MRTRITSLAGGAVAAVAALALAISPVAAGTGAVTIVSDVNFTTGLEAFTATGAFCPIGSGTSTTDAATGQNAVVFHVSKVFTCADGSGSISIDLHAVFNPRQGGTTGGWTVTGGTGAWAGASGGGVIRGTGTETGILDTYTGSVSR